MRGGVSVFTGISDYSGRSSPRAWGCFLLWTDVKSWRVVFPTCVGVFLLFVGIRSLMCCLPHVRGGVSVHPGTEAGAPTVFPTCVGVFPMTRSKNVDEARLPHVRGGVSNLPDLIVRSKPSSPRAWGCFHTARPRLSHPLVFPTCVGVFLVGRYHFYHI